MRSTVTRGQASKHGRMARVAMEKRRAGIVETAPCAWDELLRELGADDELAMQLVRQNNACGDKVRAYAARFFERRYVPEPVLAALGLLEVLERSKAVCWGDLDAAATTLRLHGDRMPADARRG